MASSSITESDVLEECGLFEEGKLAAVAVAGGLRRPDGLARQVAAGSSVAEGPVLCQSVPLPPPAAVVADRHRLGSAGWLRLRSQSVALAAVTTEQVLPMVALPALVTAEPGALTSAPVLVLDSKVVIEDPSGGQLPAALVAGEVETRPAMPPLPVLVPETPLVGHPAGGGAGRVDVKLVLPEMVPPLAGPRSEVAVVTAEPHALRVLSPLRHCPCLRLRVVCGRFEQTLRLTEVHRQENTSIESIQMQTLLDFEISY